MNKQIITVTTEGDCEGRTTKTLGTFIGTPEQAIHYCRMNGLDPYYNYRVKPLDCIDVANINTNIVLEIDTWGKVTSKPDPILEEEVKKQRALAKLSEEDKIALGLKEQ